MENKIMNHIDTLVERYPMLSECKDEIISAYNSLRPSE